MGASSGRIGPTPAGQRIQVVDVLRGFALFGVLLMNMVDVAGETVARPDSPRILTPLLLDVFDFFVTQRFLGLFSLLFGVSFVIQITRTKDKGIPFSAIYIRRLSILFLIGVAHSLLYPGDILKTYATVGLLLPLVYRWSPRLLLTLAVILILMRGAGPEVADVIRGESSGVRRLNWIEASDFCQEARRPFQNRRDAYDHGSLKQVASINACRIPNEYRFRWLSRWIPAQVLGLFLVGVVLGMTDFFRRVRERLRFIRKVTIVCALAGFAALGLQVVIPAVDTFWYSATSNTLLVFGRFLTTLAYCGGLVWLYQTVLGTRVLQPLAAVGRMALTVYLGQTIIQSFLYYGFGLDLNTPAAATVLGLSIAIFLAEIVICNAWLRHFRFGPMEWFWRTLTYAKPQPLRVLRPGRTAV